MKGGIQKIGRSERIRTSDPCVPNAVHYQAVLHSDFVRVLYEFFFFFPVLVRINFVSAATECSFNNAPADINKPALQNSTGFFRSQTGKLNACPVFRGSAGDRSPDVAPPHQDIYT